MSIHRERRHGVAGNVNVLLIFGWLGSGTTSLRDVIRIAAFGAGGERRRSFNAELTVQAGVLLRNGDLRAFYEGRCLTLRERRMRTKRKRTLAGPFSFLPGRSSFPVEFSTQFIRLAQTAHLPCVPTKLTQSP